MYSEMNEQLSMDLMYIILIAISNFTVGKPKVKNFRDLDELHAFYHNHDYKAVNDFHFESLIVKDA